MCELFLLQSSNFAVFISIGCYSRLAKDIVASWAYYKGLWPEPHLTFGSRGVKFVIVTRLLNDWNFMSPIPIIRRFSFSRRVLASIIPQWCSSRRVVLRLAELFIRWPLSMLYLFSFFIEMHTLMIESRILIIINIRLFHLLLDTILDLGMPSGTVLDIPCCSICTWWWHHGP